MKCILILGYYCSIIEHKIFFWLFVTQASILCFQILCRVTCGTLVTPVQLSQNVLRQPQVTGWADLAAVLDCVAKTATENQIVSAKNDNRLLLSKTVLRQVWDRDRKRALYYMHKWPIDWMHVQSTHVISHNLGGNVSWVQVKWFSCYLTLLCEGHNMDWEDAWQYIVTLLPPDDKLIMLRGSLHTLTLRWWQIKTVLQEQTMLSLNNSVNKVVKY